MKEKGTVQKNALIGGKYEIAGSAGKGGAGEVFRVYDRRIQKVWAAKRVAKNCPGMEAFVLGRLAPGCFPRIVDVVEEEDCCYLIMDWIEGETLQERVNREGAMTDEEAIGIGVALCDAIGSLHKMQPPLLYLDCKPSNIMTDQNGKLWLIDFGSALENAEQEIEPVAGSFGYAAPEQFGLCAEKRSADVRSDVYGLGRTLYALLSGMDPAKPPYGACPLKKCNPEVSPRLARVVERCTRERQDERFQTMEAVRNALLALQEKKRGDTFRRIASRCVTWLLLGLTLWRARVFYGTLNERAIWEKLFSFLWVIVFAAAAHAWQHFVVEKAYRRERSWEAEPVQSVLRTEKAAGRWLAVFFLCSCIWGFFVIGQDSLPTGAVHARERHVGSAAETEKPKGGLSAQKIAGQEENVAKTPFILRDEKMRKLLVREGCTLKSDGPVFLELAPEAFPKGQKVEICVTATIDDTVREYRFWYESGQDPE